jgi:superfamily II DNA/RNA helicase
LGFRDPTIIQKEAILPAIQSRMDIIGAAETVSTFNCSFGKAREKYLYG